ncbi:aldehyde dehydrogenase [Baaleninema sp.]|uniref:aldehyde dehydrogenase n=1 Tax=Baaleninema sp. TaxID=3101197 RepID=UPI003D001F48
MTSVQSQSPQSQSPQSQSPQSQSSVVDLVRSQRAFFATGQTKDVNFRLEQLKRLKQAIVDYQDRIVEAVGADLGRPEFEAYFEIASIAEVNTAIKNLKSWAKPKRVPNSLEQFPSRARIHPEPLGVVLIVAPWNYPFQLTMSPLVGAIAAGNCAILKPSEIAPHTAAVVSELVRSTFPPEYIAAIEGGVETSQALLEQKFDKIFFTGGTRIGQIVMEAAAKHLTPVTLELGGKSPCIVDADVKLNVAVKRIVWGKCINAGQTCIAPDYLLVDRRIKPQLLEAIRQQLRAFLGDDPAQSPDFSRMVSDRHFDRVASLLENTGKAEIVVGGQVDRSDRYIAPTVLDNVSWDDAVMQEEIFGPILPVLEYDRLDEAIDRINSRAKPLALYVFSNNKSFQNRVLHETSSGGACVNDTIMHLALPDLPFGGVGDSGMGSYHGKASFDTFSHFKSVLNKGLWLDLNWRYAPYRQWQLNLLKRIIG